MDCCSDGKEKGDNMSLREEVELYSKLTGKDGYNEPIVRIGAFLDGYEKGKADAEPHWIPVTEKLPGVSGCYLVSVKNDHKRRYSKTAWFEKGAWFARQDVIAWMPLPEYYKEVTDEQN
jgi:hypothetical protein